MMGCVVVPADKEKNRWQIDVNLFVDNLQKRWPNVPFRFMSDIIPTDIVEWEPKIGRNNLLCILYKDQQTISMEGGDPSDYAEVVLWYRQLVPAQYKLIFSNETGLVEKEIQMDTTEQQIVQAISI
jgi:hypothetical protein